MAHFMCLSKFIYVAIIIIITNMNYTIQSPDKVLDDIDLNLITTSNNSKSEITVISQTVQQDASTNVICFLIWKNKECKNGIDHLNLQISPSSPHPLTIG